MAGIDPKLKAEWDKKLRESGFDDIELPDGSLRACGPRLNDAHTPKSYTSDSFNIHRRYYEVAGQLVEQDVAEGCWLIGVELPAASQALIRALHADGLSNRAMERQIGVSRYLIGRVVREFAKQIKGEIESEKA